MSTSAQVPSRTLTENSQYFDGGALKKRIEPAGQRGAVMQTTAIDGLKRPLGKNYTEAGGATTTPDVVYCYDGKMYSGGTCQTGTRTAPDYPKGRLTGYGSQVDRADASMRFRNSRS